jgi:hypothetical protein
VHQTSVDRYVKANKDVWRVVCQRCGVLADDLGKFGAAFTETFFSRKECAMNRSEEVRDWASASPLRVNAAAIGSAGRPLPLPAVPPAD